MKKKKIKKLKKDIKIEAGTAALIQLNDSKRVIVQDKKNTNFEFLLQVLPEPDNYLLSIRNYIRKDSYFIFDT